MEALNKERIEYIFYHLKQHVNWGTNIQESFIFGTSNTSSYKNKIIFPLSEESYRKDKIIYIDQIPVLFTSSTSNKPYYIDENNNLVFNHDFLKSSFYLLSGYQEYNSTQKDKYDRFPYEASIQKELNIISKPVVNYYFDWMIKGIELFAKIHNYEVTSNLIQFQTILTHDIDFVDKFDIFYIGYKIKEVLKIVPSNNSWFRNFFLLLIGFFKYLKFWNRPNPYWNFDFLVESASKKINRHIFFFLEKDQLHHDSYYQFSEKRVQNLFKYLKENNCEIGLHGTIASSEKHTSMETTMNNLKKYSNSEIISNRQHRLHYKLPYTALIHEKCKIKEDFTLGFAAHEGFRNSYCHPFKLYDFENESIINVIEYPLNVMDTTLLHYHKWNFNDAKERIVKVLSEVKAFNGTFTLLWHNSNLDKKYLIDFYKLVGKILNN